MSFLSRVEIDYQKRESLLQLNCVDAFHNWVERCFPTECQASLRSRKLWRLDTLHGHHYLLMVSEEKPRLDCMEKFGVPGSASIKDYDPFLQSLSNGQRMQFRVTLNPVISIANREDSSRKRGAVKPHVTVEQQKQFLLNRAQPEHNSGFIVSPDECTIVERGYSYFRKPQKDDHHKPIRLSRVTYQGILTISDANLLRKTLTCGIGKKKAYGFGMLTVIPCK